MKTKLPTQEEFIRDVQELEASGAICMITLSPLQIITIICHLQLALRCPGNVGADAELLRNTLKTLIPSVAVTPAIAHVLDAPMMPLEAN